MAKYALPARRYALMNFGFSSMADLQSAMAFS